MPRTNSAASRALATSGAMRQAEEKKRASSHGQEEAENGRTGVQVENS